MAEMKLGYGSEYQLLRCLGHHRNSFYSEILKVIDKENSDNSDIEWLDYPIDNSKDSLDGEWKDIECFKGRINDYFQIQNQWNAFWPTKGNSQNWDGIFIYKGVWYFVEAKGRSLILPCLEHGSASQNMVHRRYIFSISFVPLHHEA